MTEILAFLIISCLSDEFTSCIAKATMMRLKARESLKGVESLESVAFSLYRQHSQTTKFRPIFDLTPSHRHCKRFLKKVWEAWSIFRRLIMNRLRFNFVLKSWKRRHISKPSRPLISHNWSNMHDSSPLDANHKVYFYYFKVGRRLDRSDRLHANS